MGENTAKNYKKKDTKRIGTRKPTKKPKKATKDRQDKKKRQNHTKPPKTPSARRAHLRTNRPRATHDEERVGKAGTNKKKTKSPSARRDRRHTPTSTIGHDKPSLHEFGCSATGTTHAKKGTRLSGERASWGSRCRAITRSKDQGRRRKKGKKTYKRR